MPDFKHFHFWCQKVLPLVYDESLSYYEVLCKVVDYLNHMLDDVNNIIKDYDELKKELNEIQNLVSLDNQIKR